MMPQDHELKTSTSHGQSNRPFLVKQSPAVESFQDSAEVTILAGQLNRDGALNSTREQTGRPVDRYNVVFFVLLLHGIGTLMPWNMFINAEDYFRNYKLSPATPTNVTQSYMSNQEKADLSRIRDNFLPYLGLAAQIPNVIFNGLNLVINMGSGELGLRINLTLILEAIVFALTIILAICDSSQWKFLFFYITLVSVVILNAASGVYQNSVFGIGAKFPGSYTNAILIGSNLCGTFTSTINLLTIWLAPAAQEAAIYYFVTALFVLLACIVSYNLLALNPFYNYFNQGVAGSVADARDESDRELVERTAIDDIPETFRETVDSIMPKQANDSNKPSYFNELNKNWSVLKKCWPQCLNVFLTFYVTLALFPAILADVGQLQDYFGKKYFVSTACFFIFNSFALIGNLISSRTTWPGERAVWVLVVARFLFVPFFLFCNYNPTKRHWPVLIESDMTYIIGNMIFALSSGYLSSLCMMFASKNLAPEEAPKAGMLAAFFLVFGIFMGVNSSFILSWIVQLG